MKKRLLSINGDCSCILASFFDTNTRSYSYKVETDKSEIEIGAGHFLDDKPDIEIKPAFIAKTTGFGYGVIGDETCKYQMQLWTKVDDKASTGTFVKPKFNDTVLEIPTEWFKFSFDNSLHVMADRLLEKWKKMPFPEDVEINNEGNPYFILRPTNLTHAILAFKVLKPEAFRFPLFRMILTELEKIWRVRKENKVSERQLELTRNRMLDCGLELISDATLGIDGAYEDKTDHAPYGWGLSLCIKGQDQRVIKTGKKHYIHLGYHSSHKHVYVGSGIRNPVEIDTMHPNDPKIGKDIADFMDNHYTPLDGSLDIRRPPMVDRFYFMETSYSFSVECYTEKFIRDAIKDVVEVLEEKYDEVVGDKNDDLDQRLVRYYAQLELNRHQGAEEAEELTEGCKD